MADEATFWTRYVPHGERDAYLAAGWTCKGPVVGHHGIYSVLMSWAGEGEPPVPQSQAKEATHGD